jgi:hypothetical protein
MLRSEMVQTETLLICILEVRGSNLGRNTDYPEVMQFYSVAIGKFGAITLSWITTAS